jgi:hypothetical protein
MSAEVTTITVTTGDATILTVSPEQSTIVSVSNASSTVINAAQAVANMPVYVNLSNDIPQQLSNTGSAGVSILASRADHSHPLTGATFNGGNF